MSQSRNKNPWNKNQSNQNNIKLRKNEDKFKQAQKKLEEAVKKYANDCESSEEEEELEKENIINNVLQQYTKAGSQAEIGRTNNFLQDAFQSGASTCLICISSIKRSESIWTCHECYCCFHLMCIQRWSKDTVTQQKQALEAQVQTRRINIKWGCPKCRYEYPPDYIPKDYLCFCGKKPNPPYQALIVPHSCGETCHKRLKPDCGHKCLLLCHPGPCPPCPQTVQAPCYCGTAPSKFQRCTNKAWSCGSQCGKLMLCGKHKCSAICHIGECQPCAKKSMQKCLCGNGYKLRDCSIPVWQCDKVCGNKFGCGHHQCDEVCHPGKCGECPRGQVRTCPCGKTKHSLPCTEDVPNCGDTCSKLLDCGIHVCHQRCHKGKCQTCLDLVSKSCRCGQHSKEVQCGKLYLCESKCKQIKDCNKHPCNRKCCDGNCPPCERPCGKTLSCKKHSCASICHQGPCYPCNMTEKVACFCGETILMVPCGRKTRTKPLKCHQTCKIAPDCHHKTREVHKCHFGECPPCRQVCDHPLTQPHCSHKCLAKCHASVLIKLQTPRAATPWEEKGPQVEKRCLPCPPCPIPVAVTCLGGHETCDYPCHMARPMSCHRACGRVLPCTNHTCKLECHTVTVNGNCESCESACTKPRKEGCIHSCPKACHPGKCPPCRNMLRIACHCGLSQPYVNCHEWTISTLQQQETLQSCGNQCPLNFDCGHRCRSNCHAPPCPDSQLCRKKVKVFCPCKRNKKEFSCDFLRNNQSTAVECDDTCKQKQLEENEQKRVKELEKQMQQEVQNKKELEKYEKLFAKKKNRERKTAQEVSANSNKTTFIVVSILGVCIAVLLYFLLQG